MTSRRKRGGGQGISGNPDLNYEQHAPRDHDHHAPGAAEDGTQRTDCPQSFDLVQTLPRLQQLLLMLRDLKKRADTNLDPVEGE